MLPETRDIAALPTSWALTLWDAMPVYLSIELAIVVAITVLVSGARRERTWTLMSTFPISSLAYALLFDPRLALILAAALIADAWLWQLARARNLDAGPPVSPVEAMRRHGGDVFWSVMKASAVAAVIKVIVGPAIASGSPWWLPAAIAGGLLLPGPVGAAAIPAVAIWSASGGLVAPVFWLTAAALRRHILRLWYERRAGPGPAIEAH